MRDVSTATGLLGGEGRSEVGGLLAQGIMNLRIMVTLWCGCGMEVAAAADFGGRSPARALPWCSRQNRFHLPRVQY
jgi:hypothetical protein